VEATAAAVREAGGAGIPTVCDHTNDAAVSRVLDTVRDEQGHLDIHGNNVWGGYEPFHRGRTEEMQGPCWELPPSDWDGMFTAGVRAHYEVMALTGQVVVAAELAQRYGFTGVDGTTSHSLRGDYGGGRSWSASAHHALDAGDAADEFARRPSSD
jgi:NAD(P)-dependent dehydrogenase (short-subunit alcohol dehydrogenase family)